MRLLGFILAASLALSLLQAALPIVVTLTAGFILWLGVTRTRETLAFLLGLTALGLVAAYPLLGLTTIAGLAVCGMFVSISSK
jgi:hypothetical protein